MPSEPVPSDQVPEMFGTPGGRSGRNSEAPRIGPPSGGGSASRAGAREADNRRSEEHQVAQIRLTKIVAWDSDSGPTGTSGGPELVGRALRTPTGACCRSLRPCPWVVLDPAQRGPAARVARWDFSADEVAQLLRYSPSGDGIPLTMSGPTRRPSTTGSTSSSATRRPTAARWRRTGSSASPAAAVRGPNWTTAAPSAPTCHVAGRRRRDRLARHRRPHGRRRLPRCVVRRGRRSGYERATASGTIGRWCLPRASLTTVPYSPAVPCGFSL